MMFVRFPRRLSLAALAVVLGAGGFGFSLAYTGSAAALAVPTVTTSVPVPTPTVPVPVPTVPVPTPTVPVPTPTVPAPTPTVPAPTPTVPVPTPTPPAPTPTVPVPTPALPAPTPTVPAPVPGPGPAPAPGVPLPTSPSVAVPTPTSPATGSAGGVAGSAPAGSVVLIPSAGSGAAGGSGVAGSAGGSVGLSGTSGAAYGPSAVAAAAAPLERSSATTSGIRVANVRGRKDVVKVAFRLPRRSRVVVTLRGPLPSCTRIARFVIQGRRGLNTFRFDGRAGGQPLRRGSYLVGLRPTDRTVTRWGALEVGSAGVRALPRSTANSAVDYCSSPAAAAAAAAGPFAIGFVAATSPEAGALIASGRQAAKSGEDGSPAATPVERPRSAGVLGVQQIDDAADAIHPVFGLAILAIMVGSLIAIVFLVVSYLRGEGLGRTPV